MSDLCAKDGRERASVPGCSGGPSVAGWCRARRGRRPPLEHPQSHTLVHAQASCSYSAANAQWWKGDCSLPARTLRLRPQSRGRGERPAGSPLPGTMAVSRPAAENGRWALTCPSSLRRSGCIRFSCGVLAMVQIGLKMPRLDWIRGHERRGWGARAFRGARAVGGDCPPPRTPRGKSSTTANSNYVKEDPKGSHAPTNVVQVCQKCICDEGGHR